MRTYTNNNRHPPGDRARVDGVQHDEVDATVRFPVRPDTFINTKSTQAGSSREEEEEGVLLPVATPAREVDRQCECYEDVHECGSTQSPANRHLEQVKTSQTGDGMGDERNGPRMNCAPGTPASWDTGSFHTYN